jgi:hypothetical protein
MRTAAVDERPRRVPRGLHPRAQPLPAPAEALQLRTGAGTGIRRDLFACPRFGQHGCSATVHHQVGHGRTVMLCFKCFWTCCKPMFQLFQMCVSIVLHGCCICCNDCTRMLQVCLSLMFHLFFVHVCCKCFRRMSQVFHLSSFVCFKCCT